MEPEPIWQLIGSKGRKVHSLVFRFTDQLSLENDFDAPEPDFLKWMDNALFADLGNAYDEYAYDHLSDEERKAWRLFHDALDATSNLLELYNTNPQLFQEVARHLSFLPCFLSWHPDADRFNRSMLQFSRLGRESMYGELRQNARHLIHQSWPVRYAYAIIATIDLTLDTYGDRLPTWAKVRGHGIKHPVDLEKLKASLDQMRCSEEKKRRILCDNQGAYRILPVWTKGLEKVRRPFNKEHVLDYWRKGKEIILEEMPDFHERPEWQDYRDKRAYQGGAKKGAIQHAIFKDILAALKTIAGANKGISTRQK